MIWETQNNNAKEEKFMNRRNALLSLLLCLCLTTAIAGCGQKTDTAEEDQLVKVVQVGKASASSTAGTYSGTVRGRYESNLAFQAGGRIITRNVQLGSNVSAGQVLMTIDPKDIVQSVNQTQAQVDAATAQLQLAQSNLSRYQQLYAQDAVSAQALEQYQTAYDQAQAQYNQVMAAKEAQENQLSYTQLTSDADGVVSAVNAEVGQVVAAGQTVLTLVHDGDMEVQIDVPENKLSELTVGTSVTVNFWALGDVTADGIVREVAPMADAASRTYKVRVSIPNPPDGMELGMTATVATAAAAGTMDVVLPTSAIYQTGDTPKVWVVSKDDTVSLVDISVEELGNDTVKVKGLHRGDTIVAAGAQMLHEGQHVRTESDTQ
jgi:multidrug efflux system membrane fusion protein